MSKLSDAVDDDDVKDMARGAARRKKRDKGAGKFTREQTDRVKSVAARALRTEAEKFDLAIAEEASLAAVKENAWMTVGADVVEAWRANAALLRRLAAIMEAVPHGALDTED